MKSDLKQNIAVLILQHPQEQVQPLATAPIITSILPKVTCSTGLSWPNFQKALGYKTDPKKWAVLYLGSAALPEDCSFAFIDRDNKIISDDAHLKRGIEGVVVLDGTWSQAKTLWWRNPWLLKLNRVAIRPFQPSLYGKLRKEPRKESVSSLEAVAATLVALGESIDLSRALLGAFRKKLAEYRLELRKSPRPKRSKTPGKQRRLSK